MEYFGGRTTVLHNFREKTVLICYSHFKGILIFYHCKVTTVSLLNLYNAIVEMKRNKIENY